MDINLDPSDLTLGDLESFEDATGTPLMEILNSATGSGRVEFTAKQLVAFIWVLRRKSEPGFTLDDARQMPVNDLRVNVETQPAPFDEIETTG